MGKSMHSSGTGGLHFTNKKHMVKKTLYGLSMLLVIDLEYKVFLNTMCIPSIHATYFSFCEQNNKDETVVL